MSTSFADRLPPEPLIAVTTFITNQIALFRLTAVCRYWRYVLIGTATLWTSIDCRNASRTLILLQRSKSGPIDVTVDLFIRKVVSLVAGHAHRMRSIGINLPSNQFGNVRRLLDASAPVLEQIRLRPQDIPPHSLFFRTKFPALRALYLEGYPIDFGRYASMMTNGLTTLASYNREHRDRCHPLEYLEHCKDLMHLKINLPNLRGTVPASHIVSLPNLRELRSVDSSLAALHHLSFPPCANLLIELRVRAHVK